MDNILPTLRRRLRRQRAVARHAWYLHRAGLVRLTGHRLHRVICTLRAHHSKDPAFLARLQREMAESWSKSSNQEGRGWQCVNCGQTAKKNAEFCGSCGKHWTFSDGQVYRRPAAKTWRWWEEYDDKKSPRQPRSLSARERKQKEKKEKAKEKAKAKAKEGSDKDGLTPTPFSNYAGNTFNSPWPQSSPFAQPSQAAASTGIVNQELVTALRAAYPSDSTMPSQVKDLIERAQEDDTRALTKRLHSATTQLGKAKQLHSDLVNTRRTHRANWVKHLASACSQWQEQLEAFRSKQAELQDAIARASKDVACARRQILQLNLQGQSPPPNLPPEEDEELEQSQDQEEEMLRAKLTQILQTCAESTGPINADAAVLEDLAHMETEPTRKRGRSAEPVQDGAVSDSAPSSAVAPVAPAPRPA